MILKISGMETDGIKKIFKKHEALFTIALIVIYVIVNSYFMQNFGYTSLQSAVGNTILSILLIILIAMCLGYTLYINKNIKE